MFLLIAVSLTRGRVHISNVSKFQVVHLLKGEEEASMELKQKTNAGRAVVLDSCYVQDHTCSSYLDDMNRHMQLVME